MTFFRKNKNNGRFNPNGVSLVRRYRMIVIGDSAVGKTSFIQQFEENPRSNDICPAPTVGIDFVLISLNREQSRSCIEIWDSPGLIRYQDIVFSYLKGKDCVICMYDVTNRASFERTILDIQRLHKVGMGRNQTPLLMLLGNRNDCDKVRKVSTTEGEILAKENQMFYREISIRNSEESIHAFQSIMDQLEQHKGRVNDISQTASLSKGSKPSFFRIFRKLWRFLCRSV